MKVADITRLTVDEFILWNNKGEAVFNSKHGLFKEYKEYKSSEVASFSIGSDGGSKFLDIFLV